MGALAPGAPAGGAGPGRGRGRARRRAHLPAVDAGRALDYQSCLYEVHGSFAAIEGNGDLVQLQNVQEKDNEALVCGPI